MYYFLDEERKKKVLNCPSCSAIFTKDKGANCLGNCPAKQLENKHLKVVEEIIRFCLPNREIEFDYPNSLKTPIVKGKGFEGGGSYDGLGVIGIFGYTLQNKKKFLRCCAHEASHIIDYENQFNAEERKILKTCLPLEEKYNLALKRRDKEELDRLFPEVKFYRREYGELIERGIEGDKMPEYERHKRKEGYKIYSELYQKLLNSHWKEYAYGNLDPLPHEYFIRDGDNEHRPGVGSLE